MRAAFGPDRVELRVEPADRPRLLVLNELYSPRWRAFASDAETRVVPVNVVMRGVLVPPGVADLELRYEPFTATTAALGPVVVGLAAMLGLWWAFRRAGTPAERA